MYQVEKIVASRINSSTGKTQFLVKWVGYDSSQNTWEPEKHLCTVKNLIQKFYQSQGKKDNGKNSPNSKNSSPLEDSLHNDEADDKSDGDGSLGSFGNDYQDKADKASQKSSLKASNGGSTKKDQPSKTRTAKSTAKTNREKGESKKSIRITGISIHTDGEYIYRILIDGEVKWVKRKYLIPNYLLELCEFYEENLTIKN